MLLCRLQNTLSPDRIKSMVLKGRSHNTVWSSQLLSTALLMGLHNAISNACFNTEATEYSKYCWLGYSTLLHAVHYGAEQVLGYATKYSNAGRATKPTAAGLTTKEYY